MIDPDRRRAANAPYRKVRSVAGRWSLFRSNDPTPEDAIEQARYDDDSSLKQHSRSSGQVC
jgi:hypothetical protein